MAPALVRDAVRHGATRDADERNLGLPRRDKLAKLVLDEVGRNAPFKKIVTAALAGAKGPTPSRPSWTGVSPPWSELAGSSTGRSGKPSRPISGPPVATITDELGSADPSAAVDRLVRFLACAEGVFERVDDSSGQIQAIFHDAADALPALIERLSEDDKARLIERLLPLLQSDDYGLIEKVVHDTIPLLPPVQLASIDAWLKARVQENGGSEGRRASRLGASQPPRPPDPRPSGHRRPGRRRRLRSSRWSRTAQACIRTAWLSRNASSRPDGERRPWNGCAGPLAPGCASCIRRTSPTQASGTDLLDRQRVRLETRILMATGQKDAAQDLRWRTFEATLDHDMLREYVSTFPTSRTSTRSNARSLMPRRILTDTARSAFSWHGRGSTSRQSSSWIIAGPGTAGITGCWSRQPRRWSMIIQRPQRSFTGR
jgi:hypothetical protein